MALDRNGNGFIDFNEFVECIKGEVTNRRLQAVRKAWESLDKQRLGQVSITDMFRIYNAGRHPAVEDGRHTLDEAQEEFEGTFMYKHQESANPDWCTWPEF